jgi:hypothetical protein
MVAHRLGAAPSRAVLDVVGGQSCSSWSMGSVMRRGGFVGCGAAGWGDFDDHYARAEHKPDFFDDPAGGIEDRGLA